MKIKKGDKIYPAITGEDVIATKGFGIENDLTSFPTVDDVLDKHQKDLDKLKSNMKYIYSYGGVGGNGSGGGTTVEKEASLYMTLGGRQIQSGSDNNIILSEPGQYKFEATIRNSNGNTFYIKVAYGASSVELENYKTFKENKYSDTLNLTTNGEIHVIFCNADYEPLVDIVQTYIVNAHTFDVGFMCTYSDGTDGPVGSYEYFIGDNTKLNPYINISYKINVPNVSGVSISYDFSDIDNGNSKIGTDLPTEGTYALKLHELKRNGIELLDEKNMGIYNVNITFDYASSGKPINVKKSFKLTLIPSHLYINVRNPKDLLYDTLDELIASMKSHKDGIPENYAYAGEYVSFYYTVYESNMYSSPEQYTISFDGYLGNTTSSDEYDYTFDETESNENHITGSGYNITVKEQQENTTPVSVPFDEVGVWKLVFNTNNSKSDDGGTHETVKYIYIKKQDSTLTWFPTTKDLGQGDNVSLGMVNSYFRANQGAETYKDFFKTGSNITSLPSGKSHFALTVSDDVYVLENDLYNKRSTFDTTILSLGMQYSSINSESSSILKAYIIRSSAGGYIDTPEINLRSDMLFSDSTSEKGILIPYTKDYDPTDGLKYHLVQIVRKRIGMSGSTPQYATYLYIDGILESNKPTIDTYALTIGKLEFNNVNVSYNLIELDYISSTTGEQPTNVDGIIYQYYLKYKETMQQQVVSKEEQNILNQCYSSIQFDGKDVIVDVSTVNNIATNVSIPTMMVTFSDASGEGKTTEAEKIKTNLFAPYKNGDNGAFGSQTVEISWSNGGEELKSIQIPSINSYSITGTWKLSLQGTSTMRNKIKNFTLSIDTQKRDEINDPDILVSPNFSKTDSSTFLPEQSWTLKADIADSAHANNTSIGKFVNKVCTKFNTGHNLNSNVQKYIRNTLEGFPFLMFVQIGTEVYYQGVYNFNLGRESYYNLGYNTSKDIEYMFNNIDSVGQINAFTFSLGKEERFETLAIGEIQENEPEFDFHQYDRSVLFAPNANTSYATMFGYPETKLKGDTSLAQDVLYNLVKSVAKAGAYCFANVGKEPVSSEDNSGNCTDRYVEKNQVPDVTHQFKYDTDGKTLIWWSNDDETNANADKSMVWTTINGDVNNLLQCITDKLKEGSTNEPLLDYTSASEYYTICMAFGMVDSILKNMTIKSWNAKKGYIAFYDMDCANGEDNAGYENVSYLAATDYWHSDLINNSYTDTVTIDYDYWDQTVGKGFDYKSSYLFAIVKYAQPVLNKIKDLNITLNRYPQEFWAILRNSEGELRNADYFVDTYFISGIGEIPPYLATLNYQVKYLYKGKVLDNNGNISATETYLANGTAFNGSRIFKVRDWLNKRIHFMDAMFNVQQMDFLIAADTHIPIPSNAEDLKNNSDVELLKDIFANDSETPTILSSNNSLPVTITAPKNTPFVIGKGGDYKMYLLAGEGGKNTILLSTQQSVTSRFWGSKLFTNIDKIEAFLTSSYIINSNNLEDITYSGRTFAAVSGNLTITSSSVKTIKLGIPTFTGNLVINGGESLHTIDISKSKLSGSWSGLNNLKNLNISSVNGSEISISDSKLLTGDNCSISGTSDNPTTLSKLSINNVSGNFNITDTKIQTMKILIIDGKEGTFEIKGDSSLEELDLTGFKSVKISGCPRLSILKITESDTNKCESIIIDMPYTYGDKTKDDLGTLTKFKSETTGVFDFSTYTSLDTLGLSGIPGMVVVKIPNKKVKIDTLQNNVNLEFVDTPKYNSCIALTKNSTFHGSPKYALRQSWALTAGNTGVYTRMSIDDDCTSLASTFAKNINLPSNYTTKTNVKYTNSWNEEVYNTTISMSDAKWFINSVVCGKRIAIPYYNDNDEKQNDTTGRICGNDCSSHITSLENCFKMQTDIRFTIDSTITGIPDLSTFTSLNNIAGMYYDTSVDCLCSEILSLPAEKNTSDNPLELGDVINAGEINMTNDAFKTVSYRIDNLSNMSITVYQKNGNNYSTLVTDSIKFTDILCPSYNETQLKMTKINGLASVMINTKQTVDYTGTFELCPNIRTLSGFLSGDLTNATFAGILKNNTSVKSISNSFNHTGNVSTLQYVNLYDLFNWERTGISNDKKDDTINALFDSSTESVPGFCIRKTISYTDFQTLLNKLSTHTAYADLTRLSNLFSYCTITGYNGEEITLSESMKKITNINSLFYRCNAVSVDNIENVTENDYVPLNIGRSFFEMLPNVQTLINTFYGTQLSKFPTYDFFAKRFKTTEPVYVYENGEYKSATLNTYTWSTNNKITSLYNCFRDVKFVDCECWFNPDNEINSGLTQLTDTISINNAETDYKTYYKKASGKYVQYEITDPDAVSDTKNNFTNYVKEITIAKNSAKILNHNLVSDLERFKNITAEDAKQYNESSSDSLDIVKIYCCLPPDIFYGCYYQCNLTGVFANTNIIGTIPQHLVSKVNYGTYKDMLLNTNILPNVYYYYNRFLDDKQQDEYKSLIANIPIDINNSIINTPTTKDDNVTYTFDSNTNDNYVVLFRDSNGILKRRQPRSGDDRSSDSDVKNNTDYSHSQYVYVPQNYTTNSNLESAFNFRYNLPKQIDLSTSILQNVGITNYTSNYWSSDYSPEEKQELWPYYTQYFFTTTESVNWSNLDSFKNPFISNSGDVDLYSGVVRSFSSGSSENRDTMNLWWDGLEDITRTKWDTYTEGYFNVFLNLCGERNVRTGEIKDYGCPVSKALRSKYTKLDSIVSGFLGTFLNGKIVDDATDGVNLSSINSSGEEVVIFTGFGRNIILPRFSGTDKDKSPKIILEYGDNSMFYDYMFPTETDMNNYSTVFFGKGFTNVDNDHTNFPTETTSVLLINRSGFKYTVIS